MGDFNPDEHTVDEINDYLATVDDDERERVLAAEREGQARKTVNGLHVADDTTTNEASTDETTTRASTFEQAADAATPDEGDGRIGLSPEAERTGRRDKGLSQGNPNVMNGGPLPDPRRGVDDSNAIESLNG